MAGYDEHLYDEVEAAWRSARDKARSGTLGTVQDYELQGTDGPIRLSEMFGDKSDLIVIHNMGSRCNYCSLWADGINGQRKHFEARAALWLVNDEKPEVQADFARTRGWQLKMASAAGSPFTSDLGYRFHGHLAPGISTFKKDTEGRIRHVASAPFRPGDVFCPVWPAFDLLEDGPNGWEPD